MRTVFVLLILLATTVKAEVYKCVVAGKTSYTDRSCDAAAQPAVLPSLSTIPGKPGDDLAKNYDERLSRDKAAREKADAEFVKDHAQKSAREKAIRRAIIDHQVIKGMTPSEVESVLGSADEKLPDGTWRYRREGQRITVRFEAQLVSGVAITRENQKK